MSVIGTEEPPQVEETQHEGWAVGWLTLGLLLTYLGAFIGVFLVLRSSRWSPRWKLAALALPAVLVVGLRAFPQHGIPLWLGTACGLTMFALAYFAAELLGGAASRASGQPRLGWGGAVVVAAVVVGGAHAVMPGIHPIGSYDLHDDVVAAAARADAAHEPYGVISDSSGWLNTDGPSRAQAERLAGPGNARFVAAFNELVAKDGDVDGHFSAEQLGSCYVFPVVTSRKRGIDSVTALARFCVGPARAGSYLTLTDR